MRNAIIENFQTSRIPLKLEQELLSEIHQKCTYLRVKKTNTRLVPFLFCCLLILLNTSLISENQIIKDTPYALSISTNLNTKTELSLPAGLYFYGSYLSEKKTLLVPQTKDPIKVILVGTVNGYKSILINNINKNGSTKTKLSFYIHN